MIDYCVLVVDDEAVNRSVARLFLERAGYRVVQADNAPLAWTLLQHGGVDLVLLDISMPGISGLDLCRLIRRSLPEGGPPVVAYTAHAVGIERSEMLQAGFDAVVCKPISKASLLDTLAPYLPDASRLN